MNVKLEAINNIDYENDTRGNAPTKIVEVDTLENASVICREYITEHDLGGGNWIGGHVLDNDGNHIAKISYNGKIWMQ